MLWIYQKVLSEFDTKDVLRVQAVTSYSLSFEHFYVHITTLFFVKPHDAFFIRLKHGAAGSKRKYICCV
jgi:hypothetical protein